jgi:hypothetical protein
MSRQAPNEQDLFGMHVMAYRMGYSHHGVYVRDNHIIQYGGGASGGKVEEVTVSQFTKGNKLRVVPHGKEREYTRSETVERAKRRLNEEKYHLTFNNCEQFATWCVTGKEKSSQVRRAKNVLKGVAASAIGMGWLQKD